jgi:hypothetical protein
MPIVTANVSPSRQALHSFFSPLSPPSRLFSKGIFEPTEPDPLLIMYCTKKDVYLLLLNTSANSPPILPYNNDHLEVHYCLKNVMLGHNAFPYGDAFGDPFLVQFDRLNMSHWIERLGVFVVASQRGLVAVIKCYRFVSIVIPCCIFFI